MCLFLLDVCRLFVHTLRILSRDYLTDFELMILLSILRVGDGAYGVPIAAARWNRRVAVRVMLAAVYAALDRLRRERPRVLRPSASRRLGGVAAPSASSASRPSGFKSVRRQARRALTRLWPASPA